MAVYSYGLVRAQHRRSLQKREVPPPASDDLETRRPSPMACPSRGSRRAGTQNDRLGESFPTVRSTCLYTYGLCSYGRI